MTGSVPHIRSHATLVLASMLTSALAAVCIGVAPALMPESYSIIENTVSESAAQGVDGAWLARLGLLLLGFGAMLLAQAAVGWRTWARALFRIYGVSVVTTAAFAERAWSGDVYDSVQATLHSAGAAIAGVSFGVGVVVVTLGRRRDEFAARVFDWVAIAGTFAAAFAMGTADAIAGLVQRGLYAVAIGWIVLEASRALRPVEQPVRSDARTVEPV